MGAKRAAPEVLLALARQGDREAQGSILELYRNYLMFLARTQIGKALRVRLEPSDLVQDTFLDAHRDFAQFAGTTEAEILVWLRRILLRNLMDHFRRQKAQVRDRRREESLDLLLERSSTTAHAALSALGPSPSSQASRREQAVLVADAIASLSEDHQEVLLLRHVEGLQFEAIARCMGRSAGAVRILWLRALDRLKASLELSG